MKSNNGNIAFKQLAVRLGQRMKKIQETLDEWGLEGWEVINVFTPSGSGYITIVAKRPLTERVRRMRSMPQMG